MMWCINFFHLVFFFYFLIIISLFYYNNYIGFIIITINEINIILKDQFDDNYCNFMPVNLLKKKREYYFINFYIWVYTKKKVCAWVENKEIIIRRKKKIFFMSHTYT